MKGILDRRWEIKIQNRNKASVNPYNRIKCLPEKDNKLRSQTRISWPMWVWQLIWFCNIRGHYSFIHPFNHLLNLECHVLWKWTTRSSLFTENSKPVLIVHLAESTLFFSCPLPPSYCTDPFCLLVLFLLCLSRKAFPVSHEARMKSAQYFSPRISMQEEPSTGERDRDWRISNSKTWFGGGRRHESAAEIYFRCHLTSLLCFFSRRYPQ